jgi:hypothetical protein
VLSERRYLEVIGDRQLFVDVAALSCYIVGANRSGSANSAHFQIRTGTFSITSTSCAARRFKAPT